MAPESSVQGEKSVTTTIAHGDTSLPKTTASDVRVSSASPRLPQRPTPSVPREQMSTSYQKRKVGTAADGKWNNYSISSKGQIKRKTSSNIRVATLTYLERMQASIPLSKKPRIALITLLALIICMIMEGDRLQMIDDGTILEGRQQMMTSCSHVVVAGLQALTMESVVSCLSGTRLYCVIHARLFADSFVRNGFIAYLLHNKPVALVFAASLGMMIAVFVFSLLIPQILTGCVDGTSSFAPEKEGDLLQKVIRMLPANILAVLKGLDLFKTIVNTMFLDAGLYIVVLVTYQLLPLAYGSK